MKDNVSQISLEFVKPGSGIPAFKIDNWTSYTFDSDFFTPVDTFSFELADDRADQLKNKINIADPVNLIVNGVIECKGFIERIEFENSMSGTVLKLSGRDLLGVVCDGTISPNVKITDTHTFEDALFKAFEGAGWSKDKITFIDFQDYANFKAETSQKGSGRKKKSKIGHQLKPHKNEGFMEFAMRICKRSGWNIKLTPDGENINIGQPWYEPITLFNATFKHRLKDPSENNIISSSIAIDWKKQPSYIIGEATGAGGNFRKGLNKVFVPNGLLLDQEDVILYNYNGMAQEKIKWIDVNSDLVNNLPSMLRNLFPGVISAPSKEASQKNRPLFEYDDEAKSMAELQYVMMKKMADFQREFFTLNILTNGHAFTGQNFNSDGIVYNHRINTMCKVIDETYGLDNLFWIQKRSFTKSRANGTRTQLTLKLPYIYVFPDIE
jgi:hypothetical protein